MSKHSAPKTLFFGDLCQQFQDPRSSGEDEILDKVDSGARLQWVWERLTDRQRSILTLLCCEGKTQTEAAADLSITRSTLCADLAKIKRIGQSAPK